MVMTVLKLNYVQGPFHSSNLIMGVSTNQLMKFVINVVKRYQPPFHFKSIGVISTAPALFTIFTKYGDPFKPSFRLGFTLLICILTVRLISLRLKFLVDVRSNICKASFLPIPIESI